MTTINAFAPAKINLALHVTGQRDDGYHLLDSLVVFADVGDDLTLLPGPDLQLQVTGPFATGVPTDARNLVWRAARLAGWTGHITLHKSLPHGAGIGGGSSDAAAVLRALGSDEDALRLGADVPVCQLGRSARMAGIGDILTPVPEVPVFPAVLVNSGVQVPTPKVFAALNRRGNAPLSPLPSTSDRAEWCDWLCHQRNDLQSAAQHIAPDIKTVLDLLNSGSGAQLVRMSGSGATCFALYDSHAQASAATTAIRSARPDWWVVSCQLGLPVPAC